MSKWGRLDKGRGENACLRWQSGLIYEGDYASIIILLCSQELPVIVTLERKKLFFAWVRKIFLF